MRRRQDSIDAMLSGDTRAKRICKRLGTLKSERGPTESILQQIADHVIGRGDFTTEDQTDRRRDYFIYDTTSINQSNRLVATLYSILFSGRWFTMGIDDPAVEDDDDVAFWLDDTSRRMLSEVMSAYANFSTSAHECLQEIADFGTTGIITEDVPGKSVRFTSSQLGNMYIGEDGHGRVDTVYRCFRFTNKQVWDRWGDKIQDATDRETFEKNARTKPDEKREIVHAVQPNDGLTDMLGANSAFVGTYVDVSTKVELETRFFDEMPIPVARWSRISGTAYGGCPGRNALPAQMMLNEMERTTMEASQKAVAPPLLVPSDGAIVPISTAPDSVIPYDMDVSSQRGPGIEYLESRGRFDVSDAAMERRKNDVREAYHSAIEEVPNGPYFTATHIVELSRQAVRYAGPQLVRFQIEFIEPVLRRVFSVMWKAGRLAPPPPILAGQELQIRYVSPAMRAQLAEDADSVRKYRLSVIEVAGVMQEALDNLDPEQSLKAEAEALGLAPGTAGVRSSRMVAAMRGARNEESQEQADTQDALQASQVVKNVAPALKVLEGGQPAA